MKNCHYFGNGISPCRTVLENRACIVRSFLEGISGFAPNPSQPSLIREGATRHAELVSASHCRDINPDLRNSFALQTAKDISTFTSHFSRKRTAFTLAEVFHPAGKSRKIAFTLAEVLITLGIIAIVAALTMPTLIQKHQEQVTINKIKKFYSVMSNATLLAINDNGTLEQWDVPDGWTQETVTKFGSYFLPYLSIAKNCGTDSGCLGYDSKVKLLSGNEHQVNYDTDNRYYKLILNDGSHVILKPTSGDDGKGLYCRASDGAHLSSCGTTWIDVNGKNPPNTVGRDIFAFVFNKNKLTPNLTDDCSTDADGFGCSGYIFKNANMNYLHEKN